MKALSEMAAKVFRAAIARIPVGETSATLDRGDQAHGGAIMALHVERIGHVADYGELYSFAHYYHQNGDIMRDPDIVMLHASETRRGGQFFPLSYQQDGLGIFREYAFFDPPGGGWKTVDICGQADLARFCNSWARNLREQQELRD